MDASHRDRTSGAEAMCGVGCGHTTGPRLAAECMSCWWPVLTLQRKEGRKEVGLKRVIRLHCQQPNKPYDGGPVGSRAPGLARYEGKVELRS